MPLNILVDESCPRCGKPITLAVIERHPTRADAAVQSFECADCGHVKTKLLSLRRRVQPELAA
jgi:hypothetical protein